MIKSMTGFGKSNLSVNSREYQVEIKTVNHKYIDINVKMPKVISYLEDDVRKTISSKLKRGKVDIYISFDNYSQDGNNVKINTELAKLYIQNLKQLADSGLTIATILSALTIFPNPIFTNCILITPLFNILYLFSYVF